MIDNFFSTIKTAFILIVLFIIVIVIIAIIKAISEKASRREKREQEAMKESEREVRRREGEIIEEQRRNAYWQKLCLIYGDKDRDTLESVLYWLEEFERLPDISDDDYNMNTMHERHECRENIKKLLNYPKWNYSDNEEYASETPIWLDLDIKYVKLLLQ